MSPVKIAGRIPWVAALGLAILLLFALLTAAKAIADTSATSTDATAASSTPITADATSSDVMNDTASATTTPPTDAATSTEEGVATNTPESDATGTPVSEASTTRATTSQTSTTATSTQMTPQNQNVEMASSSPPMVAVLLQCTSAYVGPLYNTPDGQLDPGYYLNSVPATSTSGIIAQQIGTQAWEVCEDKQGNTHLIPITDQTYAGLAQPNATMPQLTIFESAAQAEQDSF